eukprot:18240-Heterococcus_DN1.PRE.4
MHRKFTCHWLSTYKHEPESPAITCNDLLAQCIKKRSQSCAAQVAAAVFVKYLMHKCNSLKFGVQVVAVL